MTGSRLHGKSVLITGARRGIGRAIALAMAAEGARLAVTDIIDDDGLLAGLVNDITSVGGSAFQMNLDLARRADIDKVTARTIEEFGRLDILVNCAGVWIPGQTLLECSEENWDRVIDINLKGTFSCCQSAGKIMASQRSGNIINISSEVGLNPGPGGGAYSISKAGIIMLTRQMALEMAGFGIRVNAIAPGVVKTDFNTQFWKEPQVEKRSASMVPLGRLADPADIAGAAVFLASDEASYITGHVLSVNGGWHP